jgi:hypothetical protein
MRIFTTITGLAITAVCACAAVGSPALTAPAARSSPAPVVLTAFAVRSGPVMSHECPQCGGSDHCRHCIGSGAAGGNPLYSNKSCRACGGTGSCQSCLDPEPLYVIPGGKS